jgi:hypothetical protein
MNKYILIILIFLIGGCSFVATKPKKIYTQKEYEIIKQREEFIKRADAFLIHTMNKDVFSNYINLPTLSKQMIFIIPTNELLDKVHYIINTENDKINIKFHLIDKMEYFYDKVNKELLIVYNLPFSYFLTNNLIYNLKIIGSLNGEIIEKNILFDFTYHFMKQPKYFNKDTYNPSFEFVDFDDKNLSLNIKETLKQEQQRINPKKFSEDYKKLYKKLKEWGLNNI